MICGAKASNLCDGTKAKRMFYAADTIEELLKENGGTRKLWKSPYGGICTAERKSAALDQRGGAVMTELEQLQSQIDDLRDENEDLHRALQEATQLLNFYEDCFEDILYIVKKAIRGA